MWFLNYSNVIDPLLKDLRVFILKLAEAKAGERILDVGCATGDQVFHFAKTGAIVTGIDLNAEMIKIAEKRKKRERISNVDFQIADTTNLPFEDSVFDKASVPLVLHEIESEKRNKVISEMKRVVKKDGHLIFIDFSVPLPQNIPSYLIRVVEYLAGENNYENFKNYLSEGGLPFLLQKNGLKEEETTYLNGGLLTIIKTKNSFKV